MALDACGANVMLSLRDVEGITFRQALDAHDASALLVACAKVHRKSEYHTAVCEGDLEVDSSGDGLELKWLRDGYFGLVYMPVEDMYVFEEALKSHCKALMRSPGDTP